MLENATTLTHALYRFYGDDGQLLYVGITVNPGNRWPQHQQDKAWWHEVRGITVEQYPNREAALAAERRAISVEGPKYNIRRPSPRPAPAGPTLRRLVWICETCQKPVADGTGYIHVSMAQINQVERYWCDRERQQIIDEYEGRRSPWQPVPLSELLDGPDDARWLVHHAECDPDLDSADYLFDVKRARTHDLLLDWSAHLMEKNWISYTDWSRLIQRMAGVDA